MMRPLPRCIPPAILAVALIALAPPATTVRAQALVNSGAALDANLRIGSGGYNGASREQVIGGGGIHGVMMRDANGQLRRGVYHGFNSAAYDAYRGGIDRRNAFYASGGYDPNRWASSVVTATNRLPSGRVAAGAPAATGSARRTATSASFDGGYEAELADATYDSPAAQAQADALSYGIGFTLGGKLLARMEADRVDLDLASVEAGFRDGLHDTEPRMPEQEMEALLHELYEQVSSGQARQLLANPEFKRTYDSNVERAAALRDRLARDPDVVTLESGLQYKVMVEGDGPIPADDDAVTVRYALISIDGEVVTEPIRAVIRLRYTVEGVQQTLTRMKVGSVWRVAIPSSLGHGVNGRPPLHGPGVTLYFEVELLAIN